MRIRIPRLIGRKLFFKCVKWVEQKVYPCLMKTRNYGKVPYFGVKYYLVIGGIKK